MRVRALSLLLGAGLLCSGRAHAEPVFFVDNVTKNLMRSDTANLTSSTVIRNYGTAALLDLCPADFAGQLFICDSASTIVAVRESDGVVQRTLTTSRPILNMGYDPAAGILYGLPGTGASELLRIDRTTGALTSIGLTGIVETLANIVSMTFDPQSGDLFAAGGSNLYRINTTTGVGTVVGLHGRGSLFGLAYNPADGQIYGMSATTDSLYTVNRATGATTLFGAVPSVGFATGLSFSVPAAPTAVAIGLVGLGLAGRRRRGGK